MNFGVLVTGSRKRLGLAIAESFAARCRPVCIHARQPDAGDLEIVERLIRLGAPQASIAYGDLDDPLVRDGLLEYAETRIGPIQTLVNNASMFEYDTVASFDTQRFNKHLQSNFYAPVELTISLFQRAQQSSVCTRRSVITLLDQKLSNLNIDYAGYTLSKLANGSSIRFLAQCCAPNLRVNAVSPGVTLLSGDMSSDEFQQAHQIAALGRSSQPNDITDAVLWLDSSSSVTGQTVTVDGGQHLIPRARDVAFDQVI